MRDLAAMGFGFLAPVGIQVKGRPAGAVGADIAALERVITVNVAIGTHDLEIQVVAETLEEMQHLLSLDTTGMEGLESLCRNLHKRGCALILCNLNTQPASLIRRSGFGDEVGPNNLCGDLYGALARARQLLPTLPQDTPA